MLRRIILFVLLGIAFIQVRAQYDTYMFYQGINQMYMNMYQQQQANDKMLMDVINAEAKRRDANATASCVILPQGNDQFFAHITLVYVNAGNIEITIEDELGRVQFVTSDSYAVVGANVITNTLLEPGNTIYIRRMDTSKLLAKASIPSKDSSNYEEYLARAYVISQRYVNMMSGTNGSYIPNNNNSSTSTTKGKKVCSFCDGKGWRAGSKSPTYGSTSKRWCDECDKLVNPSHSHDVCPSCMGKGYI